MNLHRIGIGILCLLVAGGVGILVFSTEAAEATFTSKDVTDLVEYLEIDVSFNLKLMALDALRKKTDSGVEGELESLAKGDDIKLAVGAITSLGKKKTSEANARLRGLVTASKLDKDVRKSAMTAIAVHFKDSSDLTWMESETASDADLKAHAAWLKTNVYGKRGGER